MIAALSKKTENIVITCMALKNEIKRGYDVLKEWNYQYDTLNYVDNNWSIKKEIGMTEINFECTCKKKQSHLY